MLSAMDLFGIPFLFNLPVEWSFSAGLNMYVVESRGGAIACMLLSLLLLGTCPALLTLVESRGRLPQHTYLDYTITNFLAALVIGFTFGKMGESTAENPNFLVQLSQVNWPSVLFAMAGGAVLSLGNLSTQYALAFVGLSVTNVMTASITVVIGTTFNYFLDDKINSAVILFPGVGCFLIAVCFASGVHASNLTDSEAKLPWLCPHVSGLTARIHSAHPTWTQIMDGDQPAGLFAIGAGHVNPVTAISPGLIYDISPNDYVTHLCTRKYTRSDIFMITNRNVSCHDIMQKSKDFSLNYPSISVVFRPKMKSKMIKRRLTNVGIPNSTYSVEVKPPEGIKVNGLADTLKTKLDKGINGSEADILEVKDAYGSNTYPRKKGRSFWVYVVYIIN